jgi:hypothetical protein
LTEVNSRVSLEENMLMMTEIRPDQLFDDIEIKSFLMRDDLFGLTDELFDFSNLQDIPERVYALLKSENAEHFHFLIDIEVDETEDDDEEEEEEVRPFGVVRFNTQNGDEPELLFIEYKGELYFDSDKQILAYFDSDYISWMIYAK